MSTDTRFLGIDYGDARIGVAVSYGTLAEPLIVLPNDGTHWDRLREISLEYKITHLVVGQSENEMAEKSRQFAQELAETLGLPLAMMDETLSSKEVDTKLRSTRIGKRQHRGPIDHYAAAVILQRYLDEEW
ncbi:Holliday junction resolvase RuvX [Candidatus Woesebacteria bacterium]|nr:Holliday junction resolvase RuvX [Candidatus Woesebacteria bacterium]MCD8506722.1 Holliday junction resolvase RuvX [Candidatus Woesebacteria bacterium]MCD8527630.1 Holliday junction resolvase RuvX [Candidatus Woesebacteria bacterium]MCD8546399.1 Holliday junction resolvase RuvX [Candidatus Woesebacteria bacterium]